MACVTTSVRSATTTLGRSASRCIEAFPAVSAGYLSSISFQRPIASSSRLPVSSPKRRSIGQSIRYYSSPSSSSSTSSSSTSNRSCPNCSASISPTNTPCPSCSTLIPLPSGLSYHSLFSLSTPIPSSSATSGGFDIPAELATLPARGYALDPRDLRQRMLSRQRDLHPDRFASKGEKVVSLAKELSGRVNKAYENLVDPLKRAEYILSVHDLPTEETDSLTDPMLLAEILEAREELEEAESESHVEQLRATNHEKVETTIASLHEAFSADPVGLKEAKNLSIQLKYWLGLEAAAKEWTPGKGAGLSAGSAFTHS